MTLSEISPKSVSIGYSTIHIYDPAQFKEAQFGYAYDPEGNSLVGQDSGDWQATWLVIGYEESCGDPIFVDRQITELPVFTAMHGTGNWEPTMIAPSLRSFDEALNIVEGIAKGRENPVALKYNPIPGDEREKALARINEIIADCDIEFWKLLLGD